MYRRLKDVNWMKSDAKEAWAHYLGSRLTDMVYERCGPDLWPDRYDYRTDGMQRLEKGLAQAKHTDPFSQAVRAWKQLGEIVGDRAVAPLFSNWATAHVDLLDPAPTIRQTLSACPQSKRLADWWTQCEPWLIQKLEQSDFPAETLDVEALLQQPVELALDDGKPVGKRSISGSGHAVLFRANSTNDLLAEVRMFGCRYGLPDPPEENFHVWLCDRDFKPIAGFLFPYASFPYGGDGAWVRLKTKPTRVPPEFVILVTLNPTATKGIYAWFDKDAGGHSFTALPAHSQRPFNDGDWLIRACLDQSKR